MHLEMSVKKYVEGCEAKSNQPLSLENMLEPFCLSPRKDSQSSYLLVGHLLEQILSLHSENSRLDPLDVASMALELGFDCAESFLREGPELMVRMTIAEAPPSGP